MNLTKPKEKNMNKNHKLIKKLMLSFLAVSLITGCNKSDGGGGNGGTESQEVINQNRANEVIEAINNLGENPSEEEVARVREMYDNLINVQKRLVTNYDVLVTHENKIAASKVVALIDKLNDDSTQYQIDEVYEAYDELSEEQKAYVTNLSKLEQQAHRIMILEAISEVVGMLNELDDASSEEDLLAVKESLDALSDEYKSYIEKDLIDNFNNLLNKYREERVSALETVIDELSLVSSSFEDCLKLNVKIETIKADKWYGDVSNTAKEKVEQLEASLSQYKKVTDYSKESLSDHKEFLGFEVTSTFAPEKDNDFGDVYTIDNTSHNACFGFANNTDISEYDNLFFMFYNPNSLTDNINLWNLDWVHYFSIANVRQGWFTVNVDLNQLKANHLTDFNIVLELNRVTSPWKISNVYGYVDSTNVEKVIKQIEDLTLNTYSSEEQNAIVAARAAYNALSRGGKRLVTNISKLIEYETNVFNYHVNIVCDAIDALTYVDHSKEEEEAIIQARNLYNGLSDNEKLAVTNYSKLEELEIAVAEYNHDASVAIYQEKLNALAPLTLLSSYIDAMALAKSVSDLDNEPESIKNDPILDYSIYNAATESLEMFNIIDDGSLTLRKWEYPLSTAGEALQNVNDDVYGNLRVLNASDTGEQSLTIPKYDGITAYENIVLTVYCPTNSGHIGVHGTIWNGVSKDLKQGWNEIVVPVSLFNGTYPIDAVGIIINNSAGEWKFGAVFGLEVTDPDIIYDGKTNFAGWDYGPLSSITAIDEDEGVVQVIENPDSGEHSFLIPVNSKMNNYTNLSFKIYSPQEGAHLEIHGTSWAGVSKNLNQGWNDIIVPVSLVGQGSGYPHNGLGVVYNNALGTLKISAIKGVN